MKKAFKAIGVIIGIMTSILLVFIILSFINHRLNLSKEDKLFIPNGQIVQVNGYNIHVYT